MLSLRNFFNKKSIKKKKTESFFDCLLPIDKQNIIQITKQEATLDQITKQVEKKKKLLEVEIRTIQKSTRTTNPIFIKAHNKLRAKYNWYYKWHIWPQHEKIHISTLVLCLMAATFSIYGTFIKDLRPSLAATLSFATKVEYTGTTTTFGVASADFNKDGITDAVTANNGGSTISVFLGTGAGVFAAKTNYATGATPFSIATGDFNRDGNIDIVTANNTNTLSILLGAGNGTFPTHVEYTIGGRGWSVLTADFNRDGITDIATVNYDTSTVSILLGAGNGTFGSKTDFAAGYYPRGATIADFNKDGKIDLAVASGDNNVAVLLGNGSGGFAAQVYYATATNPSSIISGDFNRDGVIDVVTTSEPNNTLSVLLGVGNGTFSAKVDYPVGTSPYSVTIGDFNKDGKIDLATSNMYSANISILLGVGDGTFGAKTDYGTGSYPCSIVSGDFSLDGKDDVINALNGGNISVLLNTTTIPGGGASTFSAKSDKTTGSGAVAIAKGDFNLDGKGDIATANMSNDTVSILIGNGAGDFAAKVDYAVGTSPRSITVAYINADAYPDLAVANYTGTTVSILLNDGDGTFTAGTAVATGAGPMFVTSGDFNRDGKTDLVTGNYDAATVSILIGNGTGGFAAKVDYATGTNPYSVVVSDYNSDGKLDLAVANYGGGTGTTISILTGIGNATAPFFNAKADYTTGTGPISITSADFNSDGKVDLATANYGSGDTSILLNSGTGTFPAHVEYTTGTSAYSITPADLNVDGKIDLAVANYGSDNISTLLGAGNGTFGTAVNYTTGTSPRSVTANDFNRDGRVDLAVANSGDSTASVFLNTIVLSATKAITAFSISSQVGNAVINEGAHTVTAVVPTGTDVSALVATFTTTGSLVEVGATTQVSGTTANNFTNSVTYIVTAEDFSAQNYIVTITNPVPTVTSVSPNAGSTAGGTNVTIAGTNFVQPGTSITFGGVAATNVTIVNSTTITATTPAHAAGAVNIVATNPDTTTGTLSNGFTYNAAPTLSEASPSSGSKTGGDAVTLTGTNFYGTPTVTVGGTTAINIVVVNSTTITMTTPAHTVGQVNIVVTNPDTQLATLTNGFTYIDIYNLVSSAGANGSISPDGITNVASGGSLAYTITPSLHYHVLDVLVDSISQGAVTTYTFNNVSTNHTISATFTIDTFNITASGGANGSISPNGVTTVNYNGSQTYTIAADLHYHILDVLVDSVSQGAISSYTFNNVAATHTISVTFAIDTYNITASGGANGSVSPNGATSVDYNNSQAYTITPNAHYHIVDVLVDSVSQGTISSYTFNNVSAIHTISATFAIDTYLVSMNKAGSGTGSLDQTTGAFDYGSNLSIIATSDISSSFISWVGCSSVNGNICYLTNLAAQQTITATFDIKTFIVTASKTGSGSGSFSNETTTVNYGSSFSTTLSPDSNSNFISFIVCPIPSVNTCNITNIISDQSVIAQIELKPVINNIINENNQSISAVKTNSSTITINIAPNNTATEMEFSNSLDFLGATYEPIALTKTWTLSSPDINGVKTIYYRVKDQYGNESPISSMTITLDIQAPSAPTNLTVSPGINSISLSWDNPTDADFAKVVIFRSTNPNFVPAIDNNVSHYDEILNNKIGETANGDIRTFVDTNVIDGVVYYYLIKAIDDADNYSPSNPPLITGTSTQSPFEPNSNLIVEKPTEETLEILNIAVKVSETENKTIQATITWETSGSATSEVNYGKTTDYEELSVKDDNLSLFHTIILNNLGFNTTYHFNVISKNINGGLALSTDNNFTTGTVSEERPDEKSALNMFISNLTDQMVMIRDIFIVSAEQVTAAVKNTNLFISNATNISEAAVPAVASSIAVSVATVAAAAAPVANAMTVFSFPEYLKAIFYSILSLSARKKRKDWGKVVEAKTGIPIAQAKIDLIKIEKIQNEEKDLRTVVASTYSEKDGSYAFIADPGQYKIAVEKDMFFLSEEPGFYNSEIITVKNETDSLIVPSIALSMSKNETKKKLHSLQNLTIFEKVIFYVALAFLIVGTLTAISGFLKNPGSTYSIITLCLYPFLWYLSIKSMLKVSPFGQVEDATNHKGVPLALLRIMDPTGNKLIKTAVTNEEGKYKTLIDKGNYKVLISKDGYKQMKPIELLVTKKISSVNKIIELEEE